MLFSTDFQVPDHERASLYGLPSTVEFCSRCVMSNQKPNSSREFLGRSGDSKPHMHVTDRLCAACNFADMKKSVDWNSRLGELSEVCDRFRSSDGSFDVLVPGSGGKDSVFVAAMLRDQFGMTPLTVTWAPHIYTTWGRENHQRWIDSGFANVSYFPNPHIHRFLTRMAFDNLLNPFQPFILGQMVGVPKIALQHGIKFVMYGESNAEYGNDLREGSSSLKDPKYFSFSQDEITNLRLGGETLLELTERYGFRKRHFDWYLPLSQDAIVKSGLEVHNMSYFVNWNPQHIYYEAVKLSGFQAAPERSLGSYSRYSSIDDKLDDLHYWTTFIKFGIGRATYDASQEIRNGVIDRQDGVSLVHRFDGEFPIRFIDEISAYLSLPESEYPKLSDFNSDRLVDETYIRDKADSFRSPHLWDFVDNDFILKHKVS